MKLRADLEETRGLVIPDEWVISDTDEAFVYSLPNGAVVGWNRSTEIFWRNIAQGEKVQP